VQPPSSPIIVKVVEPQVRGLGLGDVILNAVGITGVLAVGALLLGLVFAVIVIGYRKRQAQRITDEQAAQTQSLGLTPTAHQ
jgi:hypothetical protein